MAAAAGRGTKEYQAIKRYHVTLINTLGKTVDPAVFARKLREKSLISDYIVEMASMVGGLTGPQRIAPVIEAVLAQIMLKADLFHTFMDVLRRENAVLADDIQQSYATFAAQPADSLEQVAAPILTARRKRCGECAGCKRSNCQKCDNCLDMPKYGGKGRRKKACIHRTCKALISSQLSHISHGQLTIVKASSADEVDMAEFGPSKETIKFPWTLCELCYFENEGDTSTKGAVTPSHDSVCWRQDKIKVLFMNDVPSKWNETQTAETPITKEKVLEWANRWSSEVLGLKGIVPQFVEAEDFDESDIHVEFTTAESRSYIGTNAMAYEDETTVWLNLGGPQFEHVVLHEFGHVLGLGHLDGLLDKEAIIDWLMKTCNMDERIATSKFNKEFEEGTKFDTWSVMGNLIPKTPMTMSSQYYHGNEVLSDVDVLTIRTLYSPVYRAKYDAAKHISREHWHAAHIAFKKFCDRVESLQKSPGIEIKNNGMSVAVKMTREKTYLPEPAICLAVDDEEEFQRSVDKDGVWDELMKPVFCPEKDGGPIYIQVQLVQFHFQLVPTAKPGSVISSIKEGGECITTVTVSIKLNGIFHIVTVGHLVVDKPKGCFKVIVDKNILVNAKKDFADGCDIALFQQPDGIAFAECTPTITMYKAEIEKNPGDNFPIRCVQVADDLTLLCSGNRKYEAKVSDYPCKGPTEDGIDFDHAMILDLETEKGDSGAAVVNKKDELVGIVVGKLIHERGKAVAFPIERGFNALSIDTYSVTEHDSTYRLSDLHDSSNGCLGRHTACNYTQSESDQ